MRLTKYGLKDFWFHIWHLMLYVISPTSIGKGVPLGDALTLVIKIKVIQFERR